MSFFPQSKVWIYQSNRKLTPIERKEIQSVLDQFTAQWQAHGFQLWAKAMIKYDFFIVFVVDERKASASGCSIDSSVRLIKQLETQFGLDLFNRFNIAYKLEDEVYVINKEDFKTLVAAKKITTDTIVFNNLVQNYTDFKEKWEVPVKHSWHNQFFAEQLAV